MHRRKATVYYLLLLAIAVGIDIGSWSCGTAHGGAVAARPIDQSVQGPRRNRPLCPRQRDHVPDLLHQLGYLFCRQRTCHRDTLPEHTTYVSSSGPGFTLIQAGPTQVVWFKNLLTQFERGWLSVTVRVNDDAPVGAGVETWCRNLLS